MVRGREDSGHSENCRQQPVGDWPQETQLARENGRGEHVVEDEEPADRSILASCSPPCRTGCRPVLPAVSPAAALFSHSADGRRRPSGQSPRRLRISRRRAAGNDVPGHARGDAPGRDSCCTLLWGRHTGRGHGLSAAPEPGRVQVSAEPDGVTQEAKGHGGPRGGKARWTPALPLVHQCAVDGRGGTAPHGGA